MQIAIEIAYDRRLDLDYVRPEVRELYRGSAWRIIPLTWKYCGRYAVSNKAKAAGRKERKVAGRELLILNYDPPKMPD